ncbi:hypothetical protein [Streptomyces sp. NPDC001435]|uniref:hypothetical protein n=1 Tax=unclassified Streptomyces TaxID=2593676 RepID=UPI0036A75EA4
MARKPAIGALAAAGLLAGAWYATAGAATTASLAVTSTSVALPAKYPYLSAGYNNVREWNRTATAVAPNGTLRVAWPASDGVHVTPLTPAGKRSGADTVVKGAKELGGLVAHDNGFALLTRVCDSNKWKETAAAIVRYTNGTKTWSTKLTGTASHDTAPTLDGQLTWNGSKYGAYFVVHGAGGFADGHYGDKLSYVSPKGPSSAAVGAGGAATTRASPCTRRSPAPSPPCASTTGVRACSSRPGSAPRTWPRSYSGSSAGRGTAVVPSPAAPVTW